MSAATSPSTNRTYGVRRVCSAWEVPRATFYDWRKRRAATAGPAKRGPKSVISDEDLLAAIRGVLRHSEEVLGFRGEGHRKVWARLRHQGIRTSKERVLRLMRENRLLVPTRCGGPRGPQVHDGKIITDRPDEMWGTDATQVFTLEEGNVWVFAAVDHCSSECVGVHASKLGRRFEALEPVHQGVREHFGALEAGVANGLLIRHDHGSQYMSDHFQNDLKFLGAESTPSFVRAPEGNGVAERFMRTLKEQVLWVHTFRNAEEVRQALQEFRRVYNESWLIGRLGHRSPSEFRRSFSEAA